MAKCELRKRFEWCGDIEPSCSAIINKFDMDTESSEHFCKLLSLKLVPQFRYLKYIDNLNKISDISTEQLVYLKQYGLSLREIADLFNSTEITVKERFSKISKHSENKKDLMATVIEYGTRNSLTSLESKWTQLNEMRQSHDEDIQLKAIKLQIEIETLINQEKDKMLTMKRLRDFMAMMEEKVVVADRKLKYEIGKVNKILTQFGQSNIEYSSIIRDIRREIESDKELSQISDIISENKVLEMSTERTGVIND